MAASGLEIFLVLIALGMIVTLVIGALFILIRTRNNNFLFIQESNSSIMTQNYLLDSKKINNPMNNQNLLLGSTVKYPPSLFLKDGKARFDLLPTSSTFLSLEANRQNLRACVDDYYQPPRRKLSSSSTFRSYTYSSATNSGKSSLSNRNYYYTLEDRSSGHLNQIEQLRRFNIGKTSRLQVPIREGSFHSNNHVCHPSSLAQTENLKYCAVLKGENLSMYAKNQTMNTNQKIRMVGSNHNSHKAVKASKLIRNHNQRYLASVPVRPSLSNHANHQMIKNSRNALS